MRAPAVGVDQTEILDNPEARGPILAVPFHLWTKHPEGQRRLFLLDEVWKSLLEPAFAAMIHNGLKTFRKYNWPILLATQSPRDALNSSLAHTIRRLRTALASTCRRACVRGQAAASAGA